jgi:long-chain acyl-CoA synthetase
VVLMPKFDARSYLALAESEPRHPHHAGAGAVPAPDGPARVRRFDLSLRMKFCTSAPFHAPLKADMLERWPGGLVEYYGMTEGGGTCILEAHNFPDKLHTVGRPAEGHDMRLIDEDGREVPPGGEWARWWAAPRP